LLAFARIDRLLVLLSFLSRACADFLLTLVADQNAVLELCVKYGLESHGLARSYTITEQTFPPEYQEIDVQEVHRAIKAWGWATCCANPAVMLCCCFCTLGGTMIVSVYCTKKTPEHFANFVKDCIWTRQTTAGTYYVASSKQKIFFARFESQAGKAVYFEEYKVSSQDAEGGARAPEMTQSQPSAAPQQATEEKKEKKEKKEKTESSSSSSSSQDAVDDARAPIMTQSQPSAALQQATVEKKEKKKKSSSSSSSSSSDDESESSSSSTSSGEKAKKKEKKAKKAAKKATKKAAKEKHDSGTD
jgi:hypothetical protein